MSWDRVHNRLHALPGTARLAVIGGGTIPDTGQYPGLPRRRRAPARRAGRGVRARAPGRRDVRAGDGDLADRGDRAAPRARGPRRGAGRRMMPFWRGEGVGADRRAGRGRRRALPRAGGDGSTTPASSTGSGPSAGSTPRRRVGSATTSPARSRVAGAVPDDRTVAGRDVPRPGRARSAWRSSRRSAASCIRP